MYQQVYSEAIRQGCDPIEAHTIALFAAATCRR
jgi:hypothetical protein